MRDYYKLGYEFFDTHKEGVNTSSKDFKYLNISTTTEAWVKFYTGFCDARQNFLKPYRDEFYEELSKFNKRLDINMYVSEEGVTKIIDGICYDIS